MASPASPSVPLPVEPEDVFTQSVAPALDDARQVIADVGLRLYRVYIRTEYWTGDRVDEGEIETVDWEEIVPPPKVSGAPPYRSQEAGGGTEMGELRLSGISRTYTREKLMLQGPQGGKGVKNWRVDLVLVPIGQIHGRTYKPAAEPILKSTQWVMRIVPTNRRWPGPE